MIKTLHCFILICVPFGLMAQMQTFVQTTINTIDRFSSKQDTINFSEYIGEKHNSSRRLITYNNVDYKIAIYQTKAGKFKEVYDRDGNKMVTIPMSGKEKNNLHFNDGRKLKWQSTGKSSYGYFKDDKEAVKTFHYMMNKQKYFVVQTYDSTITDSILAVVALDYWTSSTHSYSNTKRTSAILVAVGASTMLAIIRIATLDSEDDY